MGISTKRSEKSEHDHQVKSMKKPAGLTKTLEIACDMSAHRTAEEIKQEYIEMMGDDLGSVYYVLWNELAWLYSKWGEYVELFGKKRSRVDLLNMVAGHFFRMVQDSLWEDSLLHIARLTDPPRSAGKENLTIRKLPDLIEEERLKEKVSELIDAAVEKAEFSRDWRNRHIAHKDLRLALRSGAKPLKTASRTKVKEALGAISGVLNALSIHYTDSTTMFEGVRESSGAASLLYVLDNGLRAEEERKKRLKAGNHRAEDFQACDL